MQLIEKVTYFKAHKSLQLAGVTEDMWTPYKRLYSIFQLAISSPNEVTSDLELCLKKFKQNFTNFLRNPVSANNANNGDNQHITLTLRTTPFPLLAAEKRKESCTSAQCAPGGYYTLGSDAQSRSVSGSIR